MATKKTKIKTIKENIKIIKIQRKHFSQVVKLLSKNLTSFLPLLKNYQKIWKSFSSQKSMNAIVVLQKNIVIGYGTIFFERKIRGGNLGHIGDIVIDKKFQSKGLGRKIIKKLTEIGKKKNCYKISLQCSKKQHVRFYNKCGYKANGYVMQKIL